MTAAENIRAYLTARTQGGITAPVVAFVTDPASPPEHLRFVELREVDLEVVLQILQIFSGVGVRETPEEITSIQQLQDLPEYTLIQASDGGVFQRFTDDPDETENDEQWEAMGTNLTYAHSHIQLPARVLVRKENT